MTELICLIIGLMVGACIGAVLMCCLQLNRVNRYETEIRKLQEQFNKQLRNR